MDTIQEEIKEIRIQLRLAMNGVVSTSMCEKGVVYKLNFGVPYQEIRAIARAHVPNAELAAALWREDIREFKILASFLRPVGTFLVEEARAWVREIPYLEIAEHCVRNVFVSLPYMEEFTLELIGNREDKFARTVAFLVWAEHFKKGGLLGASTLVSFRTECMCTVIREGLAASLGEKQAAIFAMKFYGRQSGEQAREILDGFGEYRNSTGDHPGLEEIYNDLKFEFEYYQ